MKKLKIINPIIIAHSFGGRITSLLISKFKYKIDKLILIDIAGIKQKKTITKFIKEKIYKLKKKIEHVKAYLKRYLNGNYKSFKACRKERSAFREDMLNAKRELKEWEN